jgi:Flp pilus assembly protein TadD
MRAAWVALAACLIPASGAAAQTSPAAAPVTRQLVIPFDNAGGEPRIYWLSEGSAILLTDNLAVLGAPVIRREDRLRAFDRLRVPPVATLSHATVIRLGQVVGAMQVVIGSFQLEGDDLVVRARTITLDTARISPELVERGPLTDLLSIYERLARRMGPATSPGEALGPYPTLPAFEQYIKGLLAEAPAAQIAFLSQALKLYPGFQRARVALWDVHTSLGDHQRALAAVREVPAGSPLSRRARFLSGVSMIHLGQHQDAFDALTALNRERPDRALLNNLGVVQLRRIVPGSAQPGIGGTAVSYFGEAVALDDTDPDLFFNLGYAYWLNRDMSGAINWLREAVRRNPADDEAHYVLGVALQSAGNTAEAAREKELARRLSAAWAEWETAQRGASTAPRDLERLKLDIDVAAPLRLDAALVAAEQRDQRDIAAFHLEQGRRFFDQGRDEDAIAELRRTVFLAPYESEAHFLLARIYVRTGRVQDAIDALTIAVWSDPGNTEAGDLLNSLR